MRTDGGSEGGCPVIKVVNRTGRCSISLRSISTVACRRFEKVTNARMKVKSSISVSLYTFCHGVVWNASVTPLLPVRHLGSTAPQVAVNWFLIFIILAAFIFYFEC